MQNNKLPTNINVSVFYNLPSININEQMFNFELIIATKKLLLLQFYMILKGPKYVPIIK